MTRPYRQSPNVRDRCRQAGVIEQAIVSCTEHFDSTRSNIPVALSATASAQTTCATSRRHRNSASFPKSMSWKSFRSDGLRSRMAAIGVIVVFSSANAPRRRKTRAHSCREAERHPISPDASRTRPRPRQEKIDGNDDCSICGGGAPTCLILLHARFDDQPPESFRVPLLQGPERLR